MLSITRREGERVILTVGQVRIAVQLNKAAGGRARLAFIAPKTVDIKREEIAAVAIPQSVATK